MFNYKCLKCGSSIEFLRDVSKNEVVFCEVCGSLSNKAISLGYENISKVKKYSTISKMKLIKRNLDIADDLTIDLTKLVCLGWK